MVAMRNASGASLQECLAGIQFPISKADLLERLREDGVSAVQVAAVETSALDRFENAQEVVAAATG